MHGLAASAGIWLSAEEAKIAPADGPYSMGRLFSYIVSSMPVCSRQRIQFRPTMEEIKSKYYREMKKFIGIPNIFRGVGGDAAAADLIFPAMVDRNASGFHTCYYKASELFRRLESVQNIFKVKDFGPITVLSILLLLHC